VGVQPVGEVQGRIGGMQVAGPVGAPGAAGHPDATEHRGKVAAVAGFDAAVDGPVGVDDPDVDAACLGDGALGDGARYGVLFLKGTQVQMVLVEQP
jgi:hypothetical protein